MAVEGGPSNKGAAARDSTATVTTCIVFSIKASTPLQNLPVRIICIAKAMEQQKVRISPVFIPESPPRVCQSETTQTIGLYQGWNWLSFNVEISLDDLKSALLEALPGTAISIKSQTQNTSYNPNNNRWVGSLAWDVSKMYMISVTAACEITLIGMPINPSEHSISIMNGANWIGFPHNSSMTLANAFAGFAVNGDRIKSQTNNALYNGIRWQGQLNALEPGKGYIYISNSSEGRVFTFPTAK